MRTERRRYNPVLTNRLQVYLCVSQKFSRLRVGFGYEVDLLDHVVVLAGGKFVSVAPFADGYTGIHWKSAWANQ